MEILSKSPAETKKLGVKIAKQIKRGGVVCLYGDLGSGKTIFVQGLAKALGIKRRITSPTFLIIKNYGNFYHLDMYRIDENSQLENLNLVEIFNKRSNIIAIEWADRIEKFLPSKRIDVYFKILSDNERKITIKTRD